MDFTAIITALLNVPTEFYVLILGAGGVSVLTQVSKKLLSLESEKVIMFVFTSIAFLASALEYLLYSANLPPTVLGINTVVIMGIATPIYTFAVKPATLFIRDVQIYRDQINAKVAAVVASAPAPVPTIPLPERSPDDVVVAMTDPATAQKPNTAPIVAQF